MSRTGDQEQQQSPSAQRYRVRPGKAALANENCGGVFVSAVWYWRQMHWSRSKIWASALVGAVIYFSAALYFKCSYVPDPGQSSVPAVGPPGERSALFHRFPKFEHSEFGYVGIPRPFSRTPNFSSDSSDENLRSPVLLYENDHPLGPAHSLHIDIAKLGHG